MTGSHQWDLPVKSGEAGEPPSRPLSGGRHHLAVGDAGRDDAPLGVAGAHGIVSVTSGQCWVIFI